MRLILLAAVIALGVDALYFSGAYTQSAWRTLSGQLEEIVADFSDQPVRDPTSTSSTTKDTTDPGETAK